MSFVYILGGVPFLMEYAMIKNPGASFPAPEEEYMDFIIAGLTAAVLAVYLVYALLHPDKF